MFGIFKKKTPKESLQAKYCKFMEEAHGMSTSNRKLSDKKIFEAEEVIKK